MNDTNEEIVIKSLGNCDGFNLVDIFFANGKTAPHEGRLSQRTLDYYRTHGTTNQRRLIGFVALTASQNPVGFIAAHIDDQVASSLCLIVLKPYRNRGIGSALAERLARYIESRERFTIGSTNKAAIRIALKCGLNPVAAKTVAVGSDNTKLSQTLVFS